MRSDPVPRNDIAIETANRAITNADAGRIGWRISAYLFETEAWMMRIVHKQPMSVSRLPLHVFGQPPQPHTKLARDSRFHRISFGERQRFPGPVLRYRLLGQTCQLVGSL